MDSQTECIAGTGATENACFLALRSKGYHLTMVFVRLADDKLQGEYNAEKDGRRFSGKSAEELLGVVAMWEERGDNWKTRPDEIQFFYEVLYSESVIRERDGSIVENELRWM